MKICSKCKQSKKHSEFYKSVSGTLGLAAYCITCSKKYNKSYKRNTTKQQRAKRDWYYSNIGQQKIRSNQLKYLYGITQEQYDKMLSDQGGRCAICGTTEPGGRATRMCIDHDHSCCPGSKSCGKCVRGLLCNNCNRGMGLFKDDPIKMQAAVDYLVSNKRV